VDTFQNCAATVESEYWQIDYPEQENMPVETSVETAPRLAFDIGLYQGIPQELVTRAASDLAALTQEASTHTHQRVAYFEHREINGKIFCPQFSTTQDILTLFPGDPVSKAIAEQMLHATTPTIYIWISSSDQAPGWDETRINIGFISQRQGHAVAKNYAISCRISQQDCLALANTQLLPLCQSHHKPFTSTDDLRESALLFELPPNFGFVEFGKLLIPIPWAWKFIQSGQAEQQAQRAYNDALKVVKHRAGQMSSAQTSNEQIVVGASLERDMATKGHAMRLAGSGCGSSNSELLGKKVSWKDDTISQAELKNRKPGLVKQCPYCKHEYNCILEPGFECIGITEDGKKCRKIFPGFECEAEETNKSTNMDPNQKTNDQPNDETINYYLSLQKYQM